MAAAETRAPETTKALAGREASMDDKLDQDLATYRYRKSVRPLLEAVRFLDKAEAASFAESLVSLTALKRRVSPDLETVGGSIDVVFISKHDGFAWIRRKHYFDPEFNPFFLRKYLAIP
jgi:hypothetical protein